jgi:hypothetical protein
MVRAGYGDSARLMDATVATRKALAIRDELVAALGGEADPARAEGSRSAYTLSTRACRPTIGPGVNS